MLFRVKLVVVFLTAVLLLLGAVQLLLLAPIERQLSEDLLDEVASDARAMTMFTRYDDAWISALVTELGQHPGLVQAMALSCEQTPDPVGCLSRRHRDAMGALGDFVQDVQAALASGQQRFPVEPTLAMVAEPNGTVIARVIGDTADWWGPDVLNLVDAYELCERAIRDGQVHHDVIAWREDGGEQGQATLTLAAAAPLFDRTRPTSAAVGVILLGFPLNARVAADKHQLLGNTSVIFTLGGSLMASDLPGETLRDIEQVTYSGMGAAGSSEIPPGAALTGDGTLDSYIVARGEFGADRVGQFPAGFLVVASQSVAMASTSGSTLSLLLLGLVVLALGLVAVLWIVRSFVTPFVAIDQGIQQVIAGNRDHVWRVDSDRSFGAEMAQSLNVMSAFLQGKPLPDEEAPADEREWAQLLHFAEVDTGGRAALSETGVQRALHMTPGREMEPLEAYHRRIFEEYVSARRDTGADVEGLTFERFVAQVKRNAEAFREKHDCREVRFQVVAKSDRVVLKPIPIR